MIAAFSVVALVNFGKTAIEIASDLTEVQNVVDTAFGDMSYKIEDFARTSIQNFGLSKLAAKQMASTYMAMSTGMGQAAGQASDMAVEITGRLGDVMSFYNKTASEVDTIGKAIYSGETEPLKAIGVVATQANLNLFALQQGFTKTYDAMSAGEQLYVRQLYFLDKTKLAAGDFVKTSGSWANQTRVLSEQWKNFMSILGQGLIRVLTPVVRFLNIALTYLTEFATQVGSILSAVFNLGSVTGTTAKNTADIASGSENAATGLSDMGKSAKKAAKDANGGAASFDKLNNMTENIADNSSSAADNIAKMGGGSIGAGITPVIGKPDTRALEGGVNAVAEKIKGILSQLNNWMTANFSPIFNKILTNLQPGITTFKSTMSGMFKDIQSLGQPLLKYFSESFTPFLQQYVTTAGSIVVGLFNTFNRVFADIWNIAVFPIIQNFITTALPILTDFGTQFYKLVSVIFDDLNKGFNTLWTDVAAPVLGFLTKAWTDFVNILSDTWNKWGAPIMAGIQDAWKNTCDIFKLYWEKYLKPVWDTFGKTVNKLWDEHLKPMLANFMDLVGTLVNGALTIYNKVISPIVKWIVEKFGPPISNVVSGLITIFGDFFGGIADCVSDTIDVLKSIISFIVDVFTGDWKSAWKDVKNIFKGIFDGLVDLVKTPVNLIIDIINGLVSGVVSGMNAVIKALNSLKIDVPGWVTKLTGVKSFGFNLNTITAPKIPKLATGTVVPANYGNFLATLGDNKKAPEVVSPLPTMKQAFKEALAEMGGASGKTAHFTFYLGNKVLYDGIVEADNEYYAQTGKSRFAH